jgi:hypothetical protein
MDQEMLITEEEEQEAEQEEEEGGGGRRGEDIPTVAWQTLLKVDRYSG